MKSETFTYEVKCRSCRKKFKVQLFESHEKNLFVADKKDWYCDACKKAYFAEQDAARIQAQGEGGFPTLSGTDKTVSWALKIREDLLKKVDYLQKSLTFSSPLDKEDSDRGFSLLMDQWRKETEAKWWIDHRLMTVRDISKKMAELRSASQEQG